MTEPQVTLQRSEHIPELQSLRGIGAVAVVVAHCLVSYDVPPWFIQFQKVLANGQAAVVVFFVLSGYVLTRSLQKARFNRDNVLRFYVQRMFRLYPAIWAASALGLAYLFALHWQIPPDRPGPAIRHAFRPDRFDALHIVASIAGMTTFIVPQLWTIFVEIVASLALPGIAFAALYRKRLFAYLLALALMVSFAVPNTYYHTTMYLVDFVVGAGLAIPGLAATLFQNAPARSVVAAGFLIFACTQFLPFDYYSPVIHLVEMTAATLIIGVLIGAAGRVHLLRSRFLLFLGDISYSIYLLHFVVLCTVIKGFTLLQEAVSARVDTITLAVALACVTCAVTVLLAWLTFTYIEKPGIKLGRQVLQGAIAPWGRRRAGTVVP